MTPWPTFLGTFAARIFRSRAALQFEIAALRSSAHTDRRRPVLFTEPWTSSTVTYRPLSTELLDGDVLEMIFAPCDEDLFNRSIRDAVAGIGGEQYQRVSRPSVSLSVRLSVSRWIDVRTDHAPQSTNAW